MHETDRHTAALMAVRAELERAQSRFPPYNSAHEGIAVILEEVHELWEEVRLKRELQTIEKLREEAIQVATVAVRFVLDVTGLEGEA